MAGRSWRDRAPCGTDPGYQRHRYAGQLPCDDCRDAHRQEHAERRHRGMAAERAGISPAEWDAMTHDQRDDVLYAIRIRPARRRDSAGRFAA